MAGVGRVERWRQQDIKELLVSPYSFPLQPQLLYTLNLFMYKCLQSSTVSWTHKKPSQLRACGEVTQSIAFLRTDSSCWFCRCGWLYLPPLSTALCNFADIIFKEPTPKIEDKRTMIKWTQRDCFACLQKSISESSHPRASRKLENTARNQRGHTFILFLLYEGNENIFIYKLLLSLLMQIFEV